MKDSSCFTIKATQDKARVDDAELESLLQRAADFLKSRRLSTDQEEPGSESLPDAET